MPVSKRGRLAHALVQCIDRANCDGLGGAYAVDGDIVRNLTTGQTGQITAALQGGRVVVSLGARAIQGTEQIKPGSECWERPNIIIVNSNRDHWSRR